MRQTRWVEVIAESVYTNVLTYVVTSCNDSHMNTATIAHCQHCNADLIEAVGAGWVQASGPAASGGAWNYCVENPTDDVRGRGHVPTVA